MTTTTTVSASEAARIGAEAAARSAIAAAAAAENAAKPGRSTSELKVTVGSIGLAALLGVLKALAVIPGPWQLPAVLGVAAVGSAAVYSNSRGRVKAAALNAAAAAGSGAILLATPNAD